MRKPLPAVWSLFLACALIACPLGHANAQALGVTGGQDASALQAGAQQQEDPDYNGADFTRPQRSVEFRPEYRTSSGPTSETDRWVEQLRYNARLDLGGNWKLGYLLEVSVVEKTTTSFAPPSTSRDAGLGGTFTQAALIQTINQNWAYGFGARLVLPAKTCSEAANGRSCAD